MGVAWEPLVHASMRKTGVCDCIAPRRRRGSASIRHSVRKYRSSPDEIWTPIAEPVQAASDAEAATAPVASNEL